ANVRICSYKGRCRFVRKQICGTGKVDIDTTDDDLEEIRKGKNHATGMPVEFNFYDMKQDGVIYPQEMASTLCMKVKQTKQVIDSCDKDGDHGLNRGEFENCEFAFENRPLDSGKEPLFTVEGED
ncbi:unnamed protein product, partial [Owenia fusiformis]